MRRLRRTALCLGLLLAAGCHIEDHTPTGSRRDEEAVQSLVARYARTLSERDWSGARALFWADASTPGPMLPAAGTGHQAVPIDLALSLIARRVEGRRDGAVRRAGAAVGLPAGGRSRGGVAHHPAAAARRGLGGRRGMDRAPGAPPDRRRLADPEPRRHRVAPRSRA